MARYSTHKMMSMVIFVVMTFFLFAWLISQIQDFAYFFGFRMSDVVSNDVASLAMAMGGVPGTVVFDYGKAVKDSSDKLAYSMTYKNYLACAKTTWSNDQKNPIVTVDCAALPSYDIGLKTHESQGQYMQTLTKEFITGDRKVRITGEG